MRQSRQPASDREQDLQLGLLLQPPADLVKDEVLYLVLCGLCGGGRGGVESALVDSRWVVTAAHAVSMLGPFDAPYVMFGDERYEVDRIIVHPDWEGSWRRLDELHDVALLRRLRRHDRSGRAILRRHRALIHPAPDYHRIAAHSDPSSNRL